MQQKLDILENTNNNPKYPALALIMYDPTDHRYRMSGDATLYGTIQDMKKDIDDLFDDLLDNEILLVAEIKDVIDPSSIDDEDFIEEDKVDYTAFPYSPFYVCPKDGQRLREFDEGKFVCEKCEQSWTRQELMRKQNLPELTEMFMY